MILQKRLGKTSTRYMAMSHPKASIATFLEPVTVTFTWQRELGKRNYGQGS